MLNRTGYINHTVTNTTSQFGLDMDMNFLTKGLNLEGIFAYQTNSVGSLRTTQDYERWTRVSDQPGELAFEKKGGEQNTPLKYSKRSEEHTSELQSLMRNSYDVFCMKKKRTQRQNNNKKPQN